MPSAVCRTMSTGCKVAIHAMRVIFADKDMRKSKFGRARLV